MKPNKALHHKTNSNSGLLPVFEKYATDIRNKTELEIDYPYSLMIDILLASHIVERFNLEKELGKNTFTELRQTFRKLSRAENNANRDLEHCEDDYYQNHRDIIRFTKERLHFSNELETAQADKNAFCKTFFLEHPEVQKLYLDHKKNFGLSF